MTKKFVIPRGTSDILPQDSHIWQNIELKVRDLLVRYNYNEIRTPIFEESELFARSVGQTSDIVQKQMLNLASQRQGEDKELKLSGLSLRPEGTASIVRSYIQNSLDKKERLSKLFYIGPMFRGERPQKGRLRQFHQIGVEAIGPESVSPYLDAEVISLSVNILKALGLNKFDLKINTLGSSEDKKNLAALLRKQLKSSLSRLCGDCKNRFEHNIFRILDCKDKTCKTIVNKINLDYSYLSEESNKYFSQVKDALDYMDIPYKEYPKLVRGLDYYTHTVFEICHSSLGCQDALGAGGRYNNLVSQLGGSEVGAIGFALGIERIILAMPEEKQFKGNPLDLFLIALDEASLSRAFKTLNLLRQSNCSCDMSYKISSMKSQMRLANKVGARYVAFFGEEEAEKKIITVKDMETGTQQELPENDFVVRLLPLIYEGKHKKC